jgi:perosamine synthetase
MKMIDDDVISSVVKTLRQGQLFRYDCDSPEHSAVSQLERQFAQTVGSRYAVAVNSCSSALFLSIKAAGIPAGAEVLIPAFTFIAVPSAVVHAGCLPRLVEVTEDYVIDLEDLERKITPQTKALMLSYMRGRCPDLHAVKDICDRHGVILLEDAAHSLGVLFDGTQTGLFGRAAAFSAQSYKMLDGGEGGILVTDDEDLAFRAMIYSGCYEDNWKKHFWTEGAADQISALVNALPAYNFRMSNLSAAAVLPQIEQIDARVSRFNSNYQQLAEVLLQSDHIRIPKFVDRVRPAADSIQWEFRGMTPEQIAGAAAELAESGIKVGVFTGANARCFWNWTFFERHDECPYTRDLLQRTADLRLRLHLGSADIDELGHEILTAVANNA